MRNEERFESIIQIWNKLKVIDRHKSDKLHVLNKCPERKEANISEEKHEELEYNNTNHHIVEIRSCVFHEHHFFIYK